MKFNPASTSILYHSSPPHYHPQLDGERALPTTVKAWQDRGPQRSQGRGAGDGAELPQLPQTMDWQSHALGGNKTTGHSLSSGRALRAAPRAAGALPQGLCTGGRVDSSPLSAILLEKCSFFQYPSLPVPAPSPTPSETPHAECALPFGQSMSDLLLPWHSPE